VEANAENLFEIKKKKEQRNLEERKGASGCEEMCLIFEVFSFLM